MNAQTQKTEMRDHEVRERLDNDDVASGGLLALTHVHRYELASRVLGGRRTVDLCCGTGYGSAILAQSAAHVTAVDNSPEALAQVPRAKSIELVESDAVAYVSRLGSDDCDAIVCFEGIEHVTDPDALAVELARVAANGTALIVSIPNSAGFEERNPFHVTSFTYERALALFDTLGEPVVLGQYHAEGSLLLRDAPAEELRGTLADDPAPQLTWANHWIALVNVPEETVSEALARMRVSAVPNQNEYMRALERANEQLWQTNGRLARQHLGVHDSAGASVVGRLDRRTKEAERRTRDLEERLALEVEVAKQNNRNFESARAVLHTSRHRAVDALHRRLVRLPGGGFITRIASALYRRLVGDDAL
jgi:SAM-dependent methyltransferase